MTIANVYRALEEQLDILNFYTGPNARKALYEGMHDEDLLGKDPTLLIRIIDETLTTARPYFVDKWIVQMLEDALPSFPLESTLRPEDLVTPSGFVYLDGEIELPNTMNGYRIPLKCIAWAPAVFMNPDKPNDPPYGTGIVVSFYGPCSIPGKPNLLVDHLEQIYLTVNWRWNDDLETAKKNLSLIEYGEDESVTAKRSATSTMFFLALVHFMKQRIVSIERVYPDRAERRRWEKEPPAISDPLVRVITLRVKESKPNAGDGESGRHVSVRFIRRGHWRGQWYPSEGRHKPIWIHATVCGPNGAPLKRPVDLFAVIR